MFESYREFKQYRDKMIAEGKAIKMKCRKCGREWYCVPIEDNLCKQRCMSYCFRCLAEQFKNDEFINKMKESECFKLEDPKYKVVVLI